MFVGAATVFTVHDIVASLAYYRDKLGFDITFQYGEPVFYACLCRDEVSVHLRSAREPDWVAGHSALCIFVEDVDAVYAELAGRGARVVKQPQDYDYGMRDFDVADLDGNRLVFGMEAKSAGK